eukprot:Tbor_TRINITY_DN9112_c0_g1::TRINITY_DN9112_c0_g1_i1::g.14489::m.14489/K20280/TRAPPC5, TRS31; trafficking protein particle complex subunit 5
MSKIEHPLDRPLRVGDPTEVSLSAFAFIFLEMCSRAQKEPTPVEGLHEWERRLSELGREVGRRSMPLAAAKDTDNFRHRHLTTRSILTTIALVLWKRWFGKEGRLTEEAGTDHFYIIDSEPLVTKYVRMPPDYMDNGKPTINFTSFVAGIVQGALEAAGFGSKVTPIADDSKENPDQTYYLIQFDSAVLERERRQ